MSTEIITNNILGDEPPITTFATITPSPEPIEITQPITTAVIASVSSLLVGVPLTVRGTSFTDTGTVTKVEVQMGTTGVFQLATPGAPNDWSSWSFTTTPTVAGAIRITAKATATWLIGGINRTNTGTDFVDVQMAPDQTGPTLNITEPTDTAIPGDETGKDVTIKGTAVDTQSGMQRVEFSLDGGPFQLATATGANWSTWSAAVHIPALNEHTVTIRAWDNLANPTTKSIKLSVLLPFRVEDVQNNTSPLGYLKNLLESAKLRLSITDVAQPRNIGLDDLRREFLQPFDAIRTDEPVHQIRLAVEGLRKYLAATADTIFIDESLPPGATPGVSDDAWNWVTTNPTPHLSNLVHQSNIFAGMHQHFFGGANPGLAINTGDKLFAHVYIDPANVPSELMLQWNDGSWEHRAFWGADQIAFGTPGTVSRVNMGPMPAVGKWVRLEVPASVVGLEGKTINGMAFTLFNGRATFGRAGKRAQTLMAHWKFDETAGTSLADSTGNGNNGTMVNAVTLVPGRTGNAASFDGVSSSVSLVNQPVLTGITNNFTVAFWAKPDATHVIPAESTAGTGGISGQRYAIGPQQGGAAFGSAVHSGAGVSVATNGITVVEHTDFLVPPILVYQAPISGWTHVAVVFENRQPRLYVNGKLVRTGLTSPRSFIHIFPQNIGGMQFGFFKGQLDDLRIYNKPLAAWEIDALSQSTLPASPIADLKIAETAYVQSAYQVVLNKLGTSYEELRLARTADMTARTALAQRIGIDISKLDSLFLKMPDVSEEKLEKLFGLVDTTRSPLAPADVPALLIWQRDYLRSLWKQQDHPTGPDAVSSPPIVDPDVIGEEFLIKSTQANSTYSLWQQRKAAISGKISQFAGDKPAGETAKARFERLVNTNVASIADLLTYDGRRKLGKDILPDLELKQLTLPAFSYLMRIYNLLLTSSSTDPDPLLDSEWNEIYSILTQVWKVRNYGAWKTAEADLTLGPDSFVIPVDGAQSPLPAWRATEDARRKWANTLQARIDQDQALKQVLKQAVDATEEATLPSLRDALITAITATISSLTTKRSEAEIASALTEWLLIDVSGSGFQQTTRINQAIETLQGILFSLRTENFKSIDAFLDPRVSSSRSKWKLAILGPQFDAEWLWMGSYANWRAATLMFLYPENALLPTLRDNATTAFKELVTRLRDIPALTNQRARTEASTYLNKLRADMGAQLTPALQVQPAPQPSFQLSEDNRAAFQSLNQTLLIQGSVPHLEEVFCFVPLLIAARLQQARQFTSALDWYRLVYDFNLPIANRKIYFGLVTEHSITTTYQRTSQWLRDLNPHTIVRGFRADAYTKFTLMSIVRCLLEYGDSEFTADTNESVPRARMLYMNALDLLNAPEFAPPPASTAIAPNALPQNLRLHAELNLFKLRNGRNIAGMRRQLEPYAGTQNQISTQTTAIQPVAAAQLQPTPYRFSVLMDRAKQLVGIAQQIEAAYLAALEKLDAENYGLSKARQDLSLSNATVELQGLRVTEAFEGIGLAQAQTNRSQVQLDHYTDLIDEGTSGWEDAAVGFHWAAAGFSGLAAVYQFGAAATGTFSLEAAFSTGSNVFKSLASASSALASAASSSAAAASTIASYERRAQEWELQKNLALVDVAIGNQQIAMASQRHSIALKEQSISSMQMDNAAATVNFLATKFTNADLYEFMSGVLQGVFSYFLQQATATARLAQNQLSFERQEAPVSFIQADYWQAPSDTSSSGSDSQTDRRGLTGSARLLRDIYQLDQYAFDTNKRKLQLTKTISLAQLAPVEFQHFRETGVLRFGTPMEMFDRDFPGHYLRLIKRVRTSVIALIPPVQGIRATLATSGVSRVTIGGDSFQSAVVRRDPEMVALTSPTNATGLFELEQQSEMLLPFEAMGVDTSWEFQMPKPANPFDYNSVADVLISIDYTALNDVDYRQQVIRSLNRDLSAERAFSLRRRVDEWYDLNNADPTATQIITSITVKREDFAPNIESLSLKHLTLFVARVDGQVFEIPNVSLGFTPEGKSEIVLPGIMTEQGLISTRRNGSSWEQLISGQSPVGVWQLVLPNTTDVRSKFQDEKIDDILLVFTYDHRTASWPA